MFAQNDIREYDMSTCKLSNPLRVPHFAFYQHVTSKTV